MLNPIEPQKPKPDYPTLHLRAMIRILDKCSDQSPQIMGKENLMKLVNHGVRACAMVEESGLTEQYFIICEVIKTYISLLTPRELNQIFPIAKEYDGQKWQSKDYFYTIETLENHGIDTPIGEAVDELLWDYVNPTLLDFQKNFICTVSKLYQEQTGISLLEQFFTSILLMEPSTDSNS